LADCEQVLTQPPSGFEPGDVGEDQRKREGWRQRKDQSDPPDVWILSIGGLRDKCAAISTLRAFLTAHATEPDATFS
ncbi:Xylose isomerase 2, partial [Dissostichus eleginoides]